MGTLATHVDMFPSCLLECAMHRQRERKIYTPVFILRSVGW